MSVFKVTYLSDSLFRSIDLNVIIPFEAPGQPDQLALKPRKFKTLYLLHGFGGNQNDWLDYSRIRDIAEQNDLAVVLPAGENSFYVDTDAFTAQYGTLIGKELVEYTRRAFPLSDKREDTFIGGLSMGGYGAMRVGCQFYETFSKVFTFSAAFITDDIADQKPGYHDLIADYNFYVRTFGDLDKIKNSEKDPLWCLDCAIAASKAPELYLACGKDDFLIAQNRAMIKELEKRDVKFQYHESEGTHDWVFWNKNIEPAVKWVLDKE